MGFFFTILFFGFELLYSKYHLQKNFFTMNLVEAQKQVILKSNICDNNL